LTAEYNGWQVAEFLTAFFDVKMYRRRINGHLTHLNVMVDFYKLNLVFTKH
jgi:hypothetical protein